MRTKTFALALFLAVLCSTSAFAGDVLWYLGHSGYDEGHAQVVNLLQNEEGAIVDVVGTTPLPTLDSYTLIFIVMPGFNSPADFFSADEKARLNLWLEDATHRVVMVGDWDAFYQGQDVTNDLLAAIGNPIVFAPGAYDSGCGHCSGPMGDPDPLTDGIDHVCYGFTPTWDPAYGVPLAYPEDPTAPGPWIVSNGTDVPCIVGIGDQNGITDPCGYMAAGGDLDSQTFVRRLYTITCGGVNVSFGLTPLEATNQVGTSHTLTARLQENGVAVPGVMVTFTVISGPHAGVSGVAATNAAGEATFSYVGTAVGVDTIEATFLDDSDVLQVSNPPATKEWVCTDGEPCDDGNACTTDDACDGGICSGGPALSCDDDIACTEDSCDPDSGCVHAALEDCCPDPPAITCEDTDTCDDLPPDDRCPDGLVSTSGGVLVEPEADVVCGGDDLLVSVSDYSQVTQTETSTVDVCDGACFDGCFQSCVQVPLQRCYEECVLRCTNGVCLQWETKCDIGSQVTDCDVQCFMECEQNFDPVTETSTFVQTCGQPIERTLDVRQAGDGCNGPLVESYAVSGVGAASIGLSAPVEPGDYVLCFEGDIHKSFSVESCGPVCRVRFDANMWFLAPNVDGTLPVIVETAGTGGTYDLSLWRFEDDAHTNPLPIPNFLSSPPSILVPDDDSTAFSLVATNPQAVAGRTHWSNVILRAEGPTTCESAFDVTIINPCDGEPAPEVVCDDEIDNDCDGLIDDADPDCAPMFVLLDSFTATEMRGGVLVEWSTVIEIDNAGFRVLKSIDRGHSVAIVSESIIHAQGAETSGADYEFLDTTVSLGQEKWYYLEDIDLNGTVTRHGPVVVEPVLRPDSRIDRPLRSRAGSSRGR